MTDHLEYSTTSNVSKSNQPLTFRQKILFGIVCWGVQSWHQAASFKSNGYDQKHRDATRAMYTGLTIYGIGIALFISWLIIKYN